MRTDDDYACCVASERECLVASEEEHPGRLRNMHVGHMVWCSLMMLDLLSAIPAASASTLPQLTVKWLPCAEKMSGHISASTYSTTARCGMREGRRHANEVNDSCTWILKHSSLMAAAKGVQHGSTGLHTKNRMKTHLSIA